MAAGFLLAGDKGSWVKNRLAPHVEGGPQRSRKKGERFAAFSGVFRVTEQTFGHRAIWKRQQVRLSSVRMFLCARSSSST